MARLKSQVGDNRHNKDSAQVYINNNENWNVIPLFVHPPITSEREKELLAEIAKRDSEIVKLNRRIVTLSAQERRDTY